MVLQLESQQREMLDLAIQEAEEKGMGPGDITCTLKEASVWSLFNQITNEMIVTKMGRRMFPIIKLDIEGMDSQAMYTIVVRFNQLDSHRWKFVSGDWCKGGKSEQPPFCPIFIHTESPNFGHHWMKETVCFTKLKVTNKPNDVGHITLNSLHRYEIAVVVFKVEQSTVPISITKFPVCNFIAVTAYQNDILTNLKIQYNPFAKAFLDGPPKGTNSSNSNMILNGQRVIPPHGSIMSHHQMLESDTQYYLEEDGGFRDSPNPETPKDKRKYRVPKSFKNFGMVHESSYMDNSHGCQYPTPQHPMNGGHSIQAWLQSTSRTFASPPYPRERLMQGLDHYPNRMKMHSSSTSGHDINYYNTGPGVTPGEYEGLSHAYNPCEYTDNTYGTLFPAQSSPLSESSSYTPGTLPVPNGNENSFKNGSGEFTERSTNPSPISANSTPGPAYTNASYVSPFQNSHADSSYQSNYASTYSDSPRQFNDTYSTHDSGSPLQVNHTDFPNSGTYNHRSLPIKQDPSMYPLHNLEMAYHINSGLNYQTRSDQNNDSSVNYTKSSYSVTPDYRLLYKDYPTNTTPPGYEFQNRDGTTYPTSVEFSPYHEQIHNQSNVFSPNYQWQNRNTCDYQNSDRLDYSLQNRNVETISIPINELLNYTGDDTPVKNVSDFKTENIDPSTTNSDMGESANQTANDESLSTNLAAQSTETENVNEYLPSNENNEGISMKLIRPPSSNTKRNSKQDGTETNTSESKQPSKNGGTFNWKW